MESLLHMWGTKYYFYCLGPNSSAVGIWKYQTDVLLSLGKLMTVLKVCNMTRFQFSY